MELQKLSENNKMAITTYISIITLNINALNLSKDKWIMSMCYIYTREHLAKK